MELREIETFLAIIDCGTFSKAAEKLGYSQSAVTTQVKQLEHDLGTRLFDRVPRGAVLTDQGRAFAFHAQELMGAARAARASVAADPLDPHDMTGTLRIGAVESIATAILPDLLIRYHEVCPHVQAVVVSAPRDLMVEGLRNNTLDLLLTMERHLHLPGLVTHALRPEPVVFAAAPQLLAACDVAADAGDPLGAEQLVQLPFVLTEHGESYRLELDRALDALDLRIDPLVEAGNTETLVHLAEAGVGATFVPRFSARRRLDAGALVAIQTDLQPVRMETQLIHHKQKWITPPMARFIELLETELEAGAEA